MPRATNLLVTRERSMRSAESGRRIEHELRVTHAVLLRRGPLCDLDRRAATARRIAEDDHAIDAVGEGVEQLQAPGGGNDVGIGRSNLVLLVDLENRDRGRPARRRVVDIDLVLHVLLDRTFKRHVASPLIEVPTHSIDRDRHSPLVRHTILAIALAACGGSTKHPVTDAGADDAPADTAVDADEGSGFAVSLGLAGVRDPMPATLRDTTDATSQTLVVTEDGTVRFARRVAGGHAYELALGGTQTCMAATIGTITGDTTLDI